MAKSIIRVLMTGAGSPGGPGIIKSLTGIPGIELHVADMDPAASGRFLHDSFFIIPKADDQNFIPVLELICQQNKIDVILPLVTRELFVFAKNRERFAAFGTKICVSQFDAMESLNDKGRLYDTLRIHNLPCPEYYVVDTAETLIQKVSYFREKGQACVIKPCVGNGSRGIRVICDGVDRFDLLFNFKPNSIYMTLDELELIVKGRQIPKMVVSEYLRGDEVTVDTLNKNGELKLILIRRRTKMSDGISVRGEFISNEQIEQSVRDICTAIKGLSGPVGFQLKQNSEGFYHFIESNPRIQGTSVAAAGLGINLPLLSVDVAIDRSFILPMRRSKVAFVRYFEEVFYDK